MLSTLITHASLVQLQKNGRNAAQHPQLYFLMMMLAFQQTILVLIVLARVVGVRSAVVLLGVARLRLRLRPSLRLGVALVVDEQFAIVAVALPGVLSQS